MNIILLFSAVIIVIAGVLFNQLKNSRSLQQQVTQGQEETQEIKEETTIKEETPTSSPTPSIPQPTKPQSQPIPKDETLLSKLQYPNATKESSGENTLVLRSNDDPNSITDWYKEKIIGLGMNTKSFVKTRTNDNVLNKLVGADGKQEIRVEITKQADSSTTEIKVFITTD